MPSNDSLKKEIAEMDPSAITEGLNNNKLVALVKDLRANKKDAEIAEPEGYFLCEGKAITTRRGILSNGDEIKAGDITGGIEALEGFVRTLHVIRG